MIGNIRLDEYGMPKVKLSAGKKDKVPTPLKAHAKTQRFTHMYVWKFQILSTVSSDEDMGPSMTTDEADFVMYLYNKYKRPKGYHARKAKLEGGGGDDSDEEESNAEKDGKAVGEAAGEEEEKENEDGEDEDEDEEDEKEEEDVSCKSKRTTLVPCFII